MVNDPYKILEVDKNASKEEIKKAYYKIAKKYHPDLHPNDPVAAKKMTEANEAYDMLMHPDKYANKSSSTTNQSYGDTSNYQQNYQYQNHNTNYDAYGFDFESFFGFNYTTRNIEVNIQNGDSKEIAEAIRNIKARQYLKALEILNDIISVYRNDRWYFITSYANYQYGKKELAFEQIKKAVELNPNNQDYKIFYKKQYVEMQESSAQNHTSGINIISILFRIVAAYLFVQLLILLFRLLLY